MTRRSLSLRTRVLAGVALVAVVLAIVSLTITRAISTQLVRQVDDRLEVVESGLREFAERPGGFGDFDGGGGGNAQPPGGKERASDTFEGYLTSDGELVTIFTPNVGDDVYTAPDVELSDVSRAGQATFTVDSQDGAVAYRVRLNEWSDGRIGVVAIPIDGVEDTISRLVLVELIGSLVILGALGLVAWWVIHLGIRPVKEMTVTAAEIANGDLTVRVPESTAGTESAALAVALNRMLGTIQGALDERAASEERLRQFVADASHELRTPVTTIRGYAELYRHGALAERDALDDAMRRTEQEAQRMGRLVEDMLTLAKLDESRPLDRRPVDLEVLALDAVADASAKQPDRPIMADATGPVVVVGDEDRLRQVVANLVSNALAHTDPHVAIEVIVRRHGSDAVLEVRDHGDGMAPEVAARVTERFFRADKSRSRHKGGSGLGLSIVDSVVGAHGGSVQVASELGVGTTVTVTLPAAP